MTRRWIKWTIDNKLRVTKRMGFLLVTNHIKWLAYDIWLCANVRIYQTSTKRNTLQHNDDNNFHAITIKLNTHQGAHNIRLRFMMVTESPPNNQFYGLESKYTSRYIYPKKKKIMAKYPVICSLSEVELARP